VLAIETMMLNPRLINNMLLPIAEPKTVPYKPIEAALATSTISGNIVVMLGSVLPTKRAPNL